MRRNIIPYALAVTLKWPAARSVFAKDMENANLVKNPKRGKHEFVILLIKVGGILVSSFFIAVYLGGFLAGVLLVVGFGYLILQLEEVSRIKNRLSEIIHRPRVLVSFFKLLLALIVLGYAHHEITDYLTTDKHWSFIGYEYRWSENYVEKKGFNSEETCVEFGNSWLEKQGSADALFTCNVGCKPDKEAPGIDICKKICEYGKRGFLRCRE